MSDPLFYILSAALLGIVVGALIMYFVTSGNKDSDKSIAKAEEKLNNYQEDVVQHFEQTADLVDDLTQSYKKVFDHLNQSARNLMTEEQLKLQIEKRKGQKITLEFLSEESHSSVAPKDQSDLKNSEDTSQTNENDSSKDENSFSLKSEEEISEQVEDEVISDNADNNATAKSVLLADEETQENELVVDLDQEVQEREKHIYH